MGQDKRPAAITFATHHSLSLTFMEITVKTAEQLRLTAEEFELIKEKLGRTPNFNELQRQ